ncbi:MAG: transposase [Sedimenticolaceae bacterium]
MRQPVPLQPTSAVTSFPWPLRLLFASRPDALGRCLAVIVRAIQTNLTHRAGLTAGSGARTGVVTLIQRFGSALNLNIHLHMLILDGVYTLEQNGPRFHRVGVPDARSLERLLNRLVRRIVRRLTRDGLLIEDPEQPWLDLEPSDTLDHLNAALVPRPRINLTRYHGVFAPSSPIRRAIVPTPANARRRRMRKDSAAAPATRQCAPTDSRSDCNDPPTAPLTWAQRLKRVFEIDITLCGGPTHTRPHPTCSPNAEKQPATGPPARPKLQLPETRYPASGNDLSVREPCARLFRERREQASRSRGTFSTPTRQGRGKGPLNYLSSASIRLEWPSGSGWEGTRTMSDISLSTLANLAEIIGAGSIVTGLVFGWFQVRNLRLQQRNAVAINLAQTFYNQELARAGFQTDRHAGSGAGSGWWHRSYHEPQIADLAERHARGTTAAILGRMV